MTNFAKCLSGAVYDIFVSKECIGLNTDCDKILIFYFSTYMRPMLLYCWANVVEDEPALIMLDGSKSMSRLCCVFSWIMPA